MEIPIRFGSLMRNQDVTDDSVALDLPYKIIYDNGFILSFSTNQHNKDLTKFQSLDNKTFVQNRSELSILTNKSTNIHF